MIHYRDFLTRYWKRILIWTATVLTVFTLVGFFAVPPILKSVLTKQLTAALHRDVSIREVRVNPFTLSTTLRGLAVKEPNGPENFVSFEELYLNLEASSLFRWGVVVKEVRLTKPFIHVVRRQDESYNFSDLLAGRESQPTAPAKPLRFSVNNITIIDGGADLQDDPVQKKHTIRELNVGIPFVSNIPSYIETFVQPGVSVVINGTRYALQGKTKPFADSQETTLDVNIADLDLPYYLAYVPQELLTFALPSGRLDAKLAIIFVRQRPTGQTFAVKGDVGLRDLAVDDKKGNPVFRISSFGVGLASVEPLVRKVHLAKLSLQSPELTVRRENTGKTNLESLVPPMETKATASGQSEPSNRLSLDVDKIEVTGGTIRFSDLSNPLPFKATIAPIQFSADQVSNAPDKKGTFALTLQTDVKEEVTVSGDLSLEPLQATGTVDVKTVPLNRYAPYYADRIQFDIQDARLDLSARYEFAKAQGDATVKISGLSASLKSLRLRERGAPSDFLTVPTTSITDTEINLGEKQVRVGGVSTRGGRLAVRRDKGGEIYLLRLFRPVSPGGEPSAQQQADAAEKPWRVGLGHLTLDQYTVTTEDNRPSVPITLVKENVRLTAENLSTSGKVPGKVSLAFLLDKTATFSIKGNLVIESPQMDGTLEIKNLGLSLYAPYYRDSILFDVEGGTLNFSTNYRYATAPDGPQIALSGLAATLDALRLRRPGETQPFVTIPLLSVRNVAVDMNKQELSVGEFSTREGVVRIKRASNGELDILRLVPVPSGSQSPQAGQAGTAAAAGPSGSQGQPPPAWSVKLDTASVDRYRIHVQDETPAEPVSLVVEDVSLKAESLATQAGQRGKTAFALRLNQGTIAGQGSLSLNPSTADLEVTVKDLDLRPFQPYVTDRVKIIVTDGRASTEGRLALSIKEPTGLQATYTGNAALGKFAAIDKVSTDDLLKWESLALLDLSVGYNPLVVRARRVALADFFALIVIQPNGRLNLQEIVQTPEEPKPAEQPKPAGQPKPAPQPGQAAAPAPSPQTTVEGPKDIQIKEVTLQGGRILFADRSLKPNYSADITEIGGRVSGLSSEETSLADVELRGKMNNSAPLEITGKVNPLKRDLFADVRARFTGMDLSPTSPYSGKYVGYIIEKGKLSFDLKYHIENRKLESENKVFIDQFTFGEKVDSPTATSLPVRLAVALLKDRNGEIHLDLPVTGSLDDPKFGVWPIILQIIGNLITKAVTSPFALLGAAFGGGEELQYVEFDYGRATIPDGGAKKIESLVTALSEKPSLKLEIAGHVDMEADREGLKQSLLQRKLKAQKLNDLVKAGSPAVPVDEVTVAPEEYENYLTLAYRAEKFPKPRNFIGMAKSLPVPEMEKLILTHIEAGDEELHQLASQRANNVKEAILRSGKVEAERLFIVEPKTLAPEKKEKLKDSRVEFKIG